MARKAAKPQSDLPHKLKTKSIHPKKNSTTEMNATVMCSPDGSGTRQWPYPWSLPGRGDQRKPHTGMAAARDGTDGYSVQPEMSALK